MRSGPGAQHWFLSMPWTFCKERSLVENQQRHQKTVPCRCTRCARPGFRHWRSKFEADPRMLFFASSRCTIRFWRFASRNLSEGLTVHDDASYGTVHSVSQPGQMVSPGHGGIVGLLVGLSSTLFLILLQSSIALTQSFPYIFLLLPVSLALSGVMTVQGFSCPFPPWLHRTQPFAFRARGYGTEQVIRAIHQEGGKIHPRVIPVKFIATIVTIASGGSAGNVGPVLPGIGPLAQIGGALCSAFGQFIRLEDIDRVRLVICGISAGFAAVFGTPVAGALFAIESA